MTMTVAAAITQTRTSLAALHDAVRRLSLALGDTPEAESEPAIVESLREHAADVEQDVEAALRGWLHPVAVEPRVVAATADSQRAINHAARTLHTDIGSPDAWLELLRVGNERGGAWRRWSDVVRDVVAQCKERHYDALDALAGCLGEVVDASRRT
jgi:hypothetical protein